MKKCVFRALAFSTIGVAVLYIAAATLLWAKVFDFEELATLERALSKRCDILFFGDSSVFTTSPKDVDKSSVCAMLAKKMPTQSCTEISHRAYGTEIFADFLSYLERNKQLTRPKIILVVINPRSFSVEWNMQPKYEFHRERAALSRSPMALVRASVLNFAWTLAQTRFEQAPVFLGDSLVGRMSEYTGDNFSKVSAENTQKKIIVRYMSKINPQSRKLLAIKQIAHTGKQLGSTVIFYATPIDVDSCTSVFGAKFEEIFAHNMNLVAQTVRDADAIFVDCSHILPHSDFAWDSELYPNEHICEHGRAQLADSLAVALLQYFDAHTHQ